MKKIVFFCALGSIVLVNAQTGRVGINTEAPKSTLDVNAIANETARGVMVPRVTVQQLKTMTSSLSEDQNSMLVFVTDTMPMADRTGEYVDVIEPGYYFYNKSLDINNHTTKTKWERFNRGLERVAEEGKIGYRLVGGNPNYYGNTGNHAVDLSLAGYTSSTLGATGDYSFAAGYNNTASEEGSVALGIANMASGKDSFAGGYVSKASGAVSFAFGSTAEASGTYAIAMGENKATGGYSVSIGGAQDKSTGSFSFSSGYKSIATNNYTVAMGEKNSATGPNSIAIGGVANEASGSYSVALGFKNIASGWHTFAMGEQNSATGFGSTAFGGFANKATGDYSAARGYQTVASGKYSFTAGIDTVADGEATFAIGKKNTQATQGKEDLRLFIVGRGYTTKNDAFTVLYNGKVGVDIDNFENVDSTSKLQVNGGVQVSNDTNNCTSVNAGTIKFVASSKKFQGCTGDAWVDLN